jgi:hypothetical protein
MPASMSGRQWCPSCEIEFGTNHAWLHRQSKSHKLKANERFPLPPSPWAPKKSDNKIRGKFARLS